MSKKLLPKTKLPTSAEDIIATLLRLEEQLAEYKQQLKAVDNKLQANNTLIALYEAKIKVLSQQEAQL